MSGSPVPLEGLPAIWQRSNRHEVDPKLVLPLVQEKRRAFDELVRAQDVSGHLVTLAFAPLTAVMAWKARLPLTQAGMGLVTISLLFMALATWLQQRLLLDPGPRGATVREYHGRLASAYEQRIRVLRTAKWWAIPRGACVGARVPPVADGLGGDRTHDPPWLWVRYKYDVREAGKLEAKKAEVKALLGELGGEATT